MVRVTLALVFSLLWANLAHAGMLEVALPNEGNPVEYWIVLVENGQVKFVDASLSKTSRSLYLSAFIDKVSDDALVSGAAILEDGSLVSSLLLPQGYQFGFSSAADAGRRELSRLEQRIHQSLAEVERLKNEVSEAKSQLRAAAGFAEIDLQLVEAARLRDLRLLMERFETER